MQLSGEITHSTIGLQQNIVSALKHGRGSVMFCGSLFVQQCLSIIGVTRNSNQINFTQERLNKMARQ